MQINSPLVSIICLCYNHARFVEEALLSVLNQTYKNIEIIVCDDASTDSSWEKILTLKLKFPSINIYQNIDNQGNCKTFNNALALCNGKYIVDFATDDVMFPERIEKQVEFFESQQESVGVIYHNALLINEKGKDIGIHDEEIPPSGAIFSEILNRYFICPPTMMMQKFVLQQLNGYNEKLAYEDFDFWVRSSLISNYAYQNEILTKRRVVKNSLSNTFGTNPKMLLSTLKVCEYAFENCKNEIEIKALTHRVAYEIRFALLKKQFKVVKAYQELANKLHKLPLIYKIICFVL